MNNVEIRFGALSPPLHKQLDVAPSQLELEQRLADAMILCYQHGTLTESEYRKVEERLCRRILGRYKEFGGIDNAK